MGANYVLPGATSPSSSPGDQSPYAQLFAQIGPNGEVTKQMALEAFSLAIAPLPGVSIPTGAPPTVAERADGTFAVHWIMQYLDQLTPDQRAVVDGALRPAADAPSITPQIGRLAWADILIADASNAADYEAAADNARKAIAAELDRQLTSTFSVTINQTTVLKEEALAYASPVGGDWSECAIHVEPELDNSTDAALKNASMAHEMFHCFQFDWSRQNGFVFNTVPDWIVEGQAEWVGEIIAGPSSVGGDWWYEYLTTYHRPLFQRTYDAVGFYQHLDEEGISPWKYFDNMWFAFTQGSLHPQVDAYLSTLGDDETFLDTWASGNFKWQDAGGAWDARGPWNIVVHPPADEITIGNGVSDTASTDPLTNDIVVAFVNADILEVHATGHVRMHAPPLPELPTTQRWLCFDSSNQCECPPGTQYEGPQLEMVAAPVEQGSPGADFGLTGGLEGANVSLVGHSLDEYCKPAPSIHQQPGGPCQTDCGNSNGDPHLRTINRYRYDFQGAGEFVLLRNTDSSIEIQAREEPYTSASATSPFRAVSVNSAIAASDNGHRVSVYATPDGLVAHVDGQQVDPAAAPDLGTGASVKPVSGGMEIDFPDGSILWTLSVGTWGINAVVQPSDALRSSGMGLLGPITPGNMGVPALPDGTQLPAAPDTETRDSIMYGQFADAWRVTDATSLFDYEAGKSTASYTDRNFPSDTDRAALNSALSSPDPARQAEAQDACAGVTDTELQSDCFFDVYATQDDGFVQQYVAQQDLYDSGIALATLPPSSPGGVTGATKVVELQDLMGTTIGPDGTLYVSMDTAAGANELLAVDPSTAAILGQADMSAATDIHFADGSVWASGQAADATGQLCTVTRYDAQSLAKQGDYPIPCNGAPPRLVSMGDAVWFIDTTRTDPSTGDGTALTRIDPGTNTPAKSVPLPVPEGCCQGSQGAVFCYCGNSDEWRLTNDDSGFVDLGSYSQIYAAGTGFWAEQSPGAVYVDGPGGPSLTIAFSDPLNESRLVGGDPTGAYVEGEPPDTPLGRLAADGSPLVPLAKAPTYGSGIDETDLDYLSGGFAWFATAQGYLHLWTFRETPDSPPALWLQWAPLP